MKKCGHKTNHTLLIFGASPFFLMRLVALRDDNIKFDERSLWTLNFKLYTISFLIGRLNICWIVSLFIKFFFSTVVKSNFGGFKCNFLSFTYNKIGQFWVVGKLFSTLGKSYLSQKGITFLNSFISASMELNVQPKK